MLRHELGQFQPDGFYNFAIHPCRFYRKEWWRPENRLLEKANSTQKAFGKVVESLEQCRTFERNVATIVAWCKEHDVPSLSGESILRNQSHSVQLTPSDVTQISANATHWLREEIGFSPQFLEKHLCEFFNIEQLS
jgi:hypothetical protein